MGSFIVTIGLAHDGFNALGALKLFNLGEGLEERGVCWWGVCPVQANAQKRVEDSYTFF